MKKYNLYRAIGRQYGNKGELIGWVELPDMEKSSLVSSGSGPNGVGSIPYWCLRNFQSVTVARLCRDDLVWVGDLVE